MALRLNRHPFRGSMRASEVCMRLTLFRALLLGVLMATLILPAGELQALRGAGAVLGYFVSHPDPVRFHMDVELIDSIRLLNKSSTRLMFTAIAISFLGIILAAAQVVVVMRR